jgi:hypothetical protein
MGYFRAMKGQFLLFLFFTISSIFGQKKYSFDYALVYDFQLNENTKVEKRILITNSNDNSYILEVTEKDSLNYTVAFSDQNGHYSKTVLSRSDFFKAETISLACEVVRAYKNPYKYQVENYDFHLANDTLIEGNSYSRYFFKSNKLKKEKKKKLATLFFVLEKNTNFHQPVLLHPTSYEEWKLEKNIPNGIPKLFYFTSYKTKKIVSKYTLTHYIKIDKYILISKDCP